MILNVQWPLYSFSETDFVYNDQHIVQNWTKNGRRKLNKFQDFCPQDIESCHLVTARWVRLWSLNSNLFFKEPHQLTKGPLKQYLAENISLKRSKWNTLGLTVTVAIFANEDRFFQISSILPGMFSPKRSWRPPIFLSFGKSRSLPSCMTSLKNPYMGMFVGGNVPIHLCTTASHNLVSYRSIHSFGFSHCDFSVLQL